MSAPVKLFIAPRFRGDKEDIRLIRTYNADPSNELLFKKLPRDYRFTGFTFVSKVEDSDFVLLPQSLRKVTQEWISYFNSVRDQSRGKQIIALVGGDLSHRVIFDEAILFKVCEFKSFVHSNTVIMPPYTEDLTEGVPFTVRTKNKIPTIGFCGYAGFPSWKTAAKYCTKNFMLDVIAFVTMNPHWHVYKRGIYFRRKAIQILTESEKVTANFIIRDSFSGNVATTRVQPEQAREEFIGNIQSSDFVLSPKGDGNASARFFETLSLGRIPILIDTDMPLPLENIIDYSKFILRVPYSDISRLGDIVSDFYESLSSDSFITMQEHARSAYKKFLRYDAFFNTVIPLLKEKGVTALN